MTNEQTPPQPALPSARRDIGGIFGLTLLLSLVAVLGSIGWPYVLSPSDLTNAEGAAVVNAALLALLLGSTVALVLAVVAARHLLRGRWRRTWKSWAFITLAAMISLPGICVGSLLAFLVVYSLLPLTASEHDAIEVAEDYVERNGYTTAGHPKDLPVLPNDIMDALARSEEDLLDAQRYSPSRSVRHHVGGAGFPGVLRKHST
jgi:hypothetical protein